MDSEPVCLPYALLMRTLSRSYPLQAISDHVHGTILGDPQRVINGLCTLDAPAPGHITFIRGKGPHAITRALKGLDSCAAFVLEQELPKQFELGTTSLVLVPDPHAAFLDTVSLFFEEIPAPAGIDPTASIHPSAKIHSTTSIGSFCVVGPDVILDAHVVLEPFVRLFEGAHIGESTTLKTGVVVREHCMIGKHCIINDNTVIGADGFGYAPDKTLGLRKVPQLGNVILADRVEVGANSCIDRGTLGSTVVGYGTKIDNLVQIGHNVTIGKFCILCGQVGVAGSSILEDGVVLSGQVGVSDHRRLVSGVRIGGGAPVTEDILEPGDYFGHPLLRSREWHRHQTELRMKMRRRNKAFKESSSSSDA
jgi:UDP-3-O-[3-hydroxymyristoyl] glucosamine N-acyltransferase